MNTSLDLDNGDMIQTFTPGTQVFGRYTLQRLLGAGARGDVWLAKDDKLGLDVAIKMLKEYPHFRPLVSRTGRLLDLAHHAIVRVFDTAGDQQLAGFVMEYFESQPLSTLLAQRESGPFEVAEIQRWVRDLFSSLAYAHSRFGLVHQDIRLANMLVNPQGTMKVSEFGLAPTESLPTDAGFVHLPAVSPQVLAGGTPNHQDDLYSAASAVYELLTGQPVFTGDNLAQQIQNEVPPSIAERRAELQISGETVPKVWEQWIAQCLEKERHKRPASAKEVLALIEAANPTRKTTTKAAVATNDRKKKAVNENQRGGNFSWLGVVAIAGTALLVMGSTVWFLWVIPGQQQLVERKTVMEEITKQDEEAEKKFREVSRDLGNLGSLVDAQAISTKAATEWDQFITDYAEAPLAFSSEDEAMITQARRRLRFWNGESSSVGTRLANLKADKTGQLDSLDREFEKQRTEDRAYDGKDRTAKFAAAPDRLDSWDRLLKRFGGADAPQDSDYQSVLTEARQAKSTWEAYIAQQKKEAEEWLISKEIAMEGLRTYLTLPDKSKEAKLERIKDAMTLLTDGTAPPTAAARIPEFTTALLKLEEDVMKMGVPAPVAPFPTTLAELFKNTPLADKSEAAQKKGLITLKQQLITDGFYKSQPDDKIDPALEQSLKDWQASKALTVTGRLDTATWAATTVSKVDVAELESTSDMPSGETSPVVVKRPKSTKKAEPPKTEEKRNVATKAVDSAKKGFTWMKNKLTGKTPPPETSKKK